MGPESPGRWERGKGVGQKVRGKGPGKLRYMGEGVGQELACLGLVKGVWLDGVTGQGYGGEG